MFNDFLRSHICLDRVAPLVAQTIPRFWGKIVPISLKVFPNFPQGVSRVGGEQSVNVYSEANGQDLDNLTDSDATQTANIPR